MIYEQLQLDGLQSLESTPPQSQSCRQVSPVSLTALREKVRAIVTSVTFGAKLQEFSASLDRSGLSVRIRPVYFQERINGISDGFSMTLPRWGIASGGEFGELVTSEHRTNATGCLSWRTPMASDSLFSERQDGYLIRTWKTHATKHLTAQVVYMERFPTPTVCGNGNRKGSSKKAGDGLETFVKKFSTPVADDTSYRKDKYQQGGTALSTAVGGKLNPTWVEWLMGFPLGWTDLGV